MNVNSGEVPTPRPIESLSVQELRQESIDRVNNTLDNLPIGPVADGTATFGFRRKKQGLPELMCSYIQYSKVFREERQVGIQVSLLGMFEGHTLAVYQNIVERDLKKSEQLNDDEKADLGRSIQTLRRLQEGAKKDGITPDDNRYYFVPLDPVQPAVVSVESFIARAHSVNPHAAERALLPEDIATAQQIENQPIGLNFQLLILPRQAFNGSLNCITTESTHWKYTSFIIIK